jgi:steroid delta-isomerase-like uncharacterized protein
VVFESGDLDAIDEFIAADHVNHDPTAPEVERGPAGVRTLAELYRSAFPDIAFEHADMFAAGDRVVHRWTLTGTHEGEMMGVAATGRRVRVSGLEINRIADGKIAESWAISDALGMLSQLGVDVPTP